MSTRVRLTHAFVLVLLLALAPGLRADEAMADLIRRAMALEEQDDHAGLVELLDPHSGSDDPDLLYPLAMAHFRLATEGEGGDGPDTGAIRLALEIGGRAAALGRAEAGTLLYLIHFHGIGVARDLPLALDHLNRAAEAGDVAAQLNLLVLSYEGTPELAVDLPTACRQLQRLAAGQAGIPLVRHYQGMAIARGQCGTAKDMHAGFALIEQAAGDGFVQAQVMLGMALQAGWLGAPAAGPAMDWFERAAAQQDAYAQWQLGKAHATGELRQRDDARAVSLFESAVAAGLPEAHTSLAVMYATGAGVRQDFNRALTLYAEAVAIGDTHALRNLAVMYALGEGTPPDPVQAKLHYLQHLHFGHPPSEALASMIDGQLDPQGRKDVETRFRNWLSTLPRER